MSHCGMSLPAARGPLPTRTGTGAGAMVTWPWAAGAGPGNAAAAGASEPLQRCFSGPLSAAIRYWRVGTESPSPLPPAADRPAGPAVPWLTGLGERQRWRRAAHGLMWDLAALAGTRMKQVRRTGRGGQTAVWELKVKCYFMMCT